MSALSEIALLSSTASSLAACALTTLNIAAHGRPRPRPNRKRSRTRGRS
jgi:hypothetical protein